MSFHQTSLVAFCLLAALFSATTAKPTSPDSSYCVMNNQKHDVGDILTPTDNCVQYTCLPNYGGWNTTNCQEFEASPSCILRPGDETKSYPECCPTIVC